MALSALSQVYATKRDFDSDSLTFNFTFLSLLLDHESQSFTVDNRPVFIYPKCTDCVHVFSAYKSQLLRPHSRFLFFPPHDQQRRRSDNRFTVPLLTSSARSRTLTRALHSRIPNCQHPRCLQALQHPPLCASPPLPFAALFPSGHGPTRADSIALRYRQRLL